MSPLIPWNAGGAFVISALALGIFHARTGMFSPRATAADAPLAAGPAVKPAA